MSNDTDSKWLKVGAVLKGKKGGYYLRVDESIKLKKGDNLTLRTPSEGLDGLVAAGHLDEEKAEERKAKIPKYIKYDVLRPPLTDD